MKIKKPVSPDREEVRGQLRRICCSKNFKSSPRLTGLLEFLVEEVLSGNGDSLGEYRVGIEALGLPQDFDPGAKSLVRSHAGRLRKALAAYYSGAGRDDLILISMPDVGYCVAFSRLGVGPRRSASPAKLPLLMLAEFRGIGLKADLHDLPATVAEELSIRLARAAHLRVSRAGSGIAGLDPDFLLEGSIEHRGGKVLIRSRLMEGTTGLQIWARRHEFPAADWDLGTMEEKIIDAIAVETTSDFGRIERHLLRQGAKAKTQAASLQAAMLKFKAFETDYSEKSFRAAELALRKFLKVSPANPDAHALLGLLFFFAHLEYFRRDEPFPAIALEHFAVALAGDPTNAYARYGRFLALLAQGKYSALAETGADLLSDPSFPPGVAAAVCMCLMYAKKATPRSRRLLAAHMEKNPEYPRLFHTPFALEHLAAGRHAAARREMDQAFNSGNWFSLLLLLGVEHSAGCRAEAAAARAELRRLCPDFGRCGRELLGRSLHPDFAGLLMAAWEARV
jgi:TolB-like protein